MTDEAVRRGLLDTNIMILRSLVAPDELPDEMAISAVTLAELSAGPHEVRPDTGGIRQLGFSRTATWLVVASEAPTTIWRCR
jgi:hypothetical protein